MFSGGELNRLMVRPLLIVGALIVTALATGLLAGLWLTRESPSSTISDTCAPISSAAKSALDTMLPEAEAEFHKALSTLNSDTFEAVCDMLRKSE